MRETGAASAAKGNSRDGGSKDEDSGREVTKIVKKQRGVERGNDAGIDSGAKVGGQVVPVALIHLDKRPGRGTQNGIRVQLLEKRHKIYQVQNMKLLGV